MEVNQGSPLVGSLSINGQVIIKEQGFGGPLLYFNRKIYIPVFIRRFYVVGFRLATLDLDDLSNWVYWGYRRLGLSERDKR